MKKFGIIGQSKMMVSLRALGGSKSNSGLNGLTLVICRRKESGTLVYFYLLPVKSVIFVFFLFLFRAILQLLRVANN